MAIAKTRQAPPAAVGVNFGDDAMYAGGFNLPEGDYAFFFEAMNHAFTKGDGTRGQEKFGIMVTAYPLAGGEPVTQFYSMGTKAHLSFTADPDSGGKRIVAIPGAPAATFAQKTNWDALRRSLYDCGLPPGVFTNDLTAIDGTWVHTQNVAEPEDRKGFGAATGEVAQERAQQGPQMISVVTEIKDDGKPWEETGGMPEGAGEPAPAPKPAARPAFKPVAAKPAAAAKVAARPAAPVAEAEEVPDVLQMAIEGASAVLEKNAQGTTKLMVKTQAFAFVKKTYGDPAAQAVTKLLNTDEGYESVVSPLGYAVSGANIVPQA